MLKLRHQPKKRLKLSKDNILIGEIKGAHGVKGLVRLGLYVDNIDLFNHEITYDITLKNRHKDKLWLANIIGITSKEDADALKGTKLYCPASALPDIDDDEFYFSDLIGMECINHDSQAVGTVIATENFGAGDLLEIKPVNGTSFYLTYSTKTVSFVDNKLKVLVPEMI
jgi:16S rRNA processing protein RimM